MTDTESESLSDRYDGSFSLGGREFGVMKHSRDKATTTFLFRFHVEEERKHPKHTFSHLRDGIRRSDLTLDTIREEIQRFEKNRPEYTVTAVGVEETTVARSVEVLNND